LPDISTALGSHHGEVKRLRRLLRDADARDDEGVFVGEGPRVVDAALLTTVGRVYVGVDASAAARAVAERAAALGVEVRELAPGVAARVADTNHTQGVFVVAPKPRTTLAALDDADLILVCAAVADPGNAGTVLRSATAAGVDGVVLGAGSVDAYNPKVVRASAGACFTFPIVEDVAVVDTLETLGARGWQRVAAVPTGGVTPEACDLTARTAIVVGHETRGLGGALPVDDTVTIPMAGAESLNLAMAATVLVFEAARQRRVAGLS
jgi:TrmH family RNA methyltransferase